MAQEKTQEIIQQIIKATDENDIEALTKLARHVSLELLEILEKENPMLIDLYLWRMEHLDKRWTDTMRLHNALEILYTYLRLKKHLND